MKGFSLLSLAVIVAIGIGVVVEKSFSAAPSTSISVLVTSPDVDEGAVQIERTYLATGFATRGPILATFQWDSGSHPEWVTAPGVLWLFELETSNGPTVWRISDTTGEVLQHTKIPPLVRPILAADSTGLFLGGAGSFGGVGDGLIFHVGVGATSTTTVFTPAPKPAALEFVDSLSALGDTVVADVCVRPLPRPCQVRRFRVPAR